MRLAASNIAWPEADDDAVTRILVSLGYNGLEIAPTRVWRMPLATTANERITFRRRWEARGLPVVAMQALVFDRPDLLVFGSLEKREALIAHLEGMIALAADLGARALVFGSPRNRSVAGVSPERVYAIAIPFFRRLGDAAAARGVAFCIEPNPSEYGCDFATDATQALTLVQRVASPGFGLHLDAGGMTLSGNAEHAAREGASHARHFHASEPYLKPLGSGGADHARLASILREEGYRGWVSVEMRAPTGEDRLAVLQRSLATAAEHYRGAFRTACREPPSPHR